MIVGIFGTWDLDCFEKPETVLKRKLEKNPTYPFREQEPSVYVLTVKSSTLLTGIILCLTCMGGTFLLYKIKDEYVIFGIITFLGFCQVLVYNWQNRTFVLDTNANVYEFYKGSRLAYRGHLHNIYIRLKGVKTGSGEIYYRVVLDGFEVDEEAISGATTRHDKLARLGRRLAHRLNINFFDYQDKCRYHVVRHRCPYRERAGSLSKKTPKPPVTDAETAVKA